ncbi:hypothetical protein [Streptomyces sp. ODS28]|uniref:terpene synthase family protein n=1 Tax=Streptomyces sp. ODS28 TaxID=3136688 RepID=UPI0031E72F56
MPAIDLDLPFPYRINEHVERAREHNVAWLQHHGLLTPGPVTHAYLQHMLAEGTALAFPHLDAPGLELATVAVAAFLDDLMSKNAHLPATARRLHARYDAVMDDRSAPPEQDPLALAWCEVWARLKRGKSPWWCRQSRARWRDFLSVALEEARAESADTPPDLLTYTTLRRRSMAISSSTTSPRHAAASRHPAAPSNTPS